VPIGTFLPGSRLDRRTETRDARHHDLVTKPWPVGTLVRDWETLFFADINSIKPLYPVVVSTHFATAAPLHVLERTKYYSIELFRIFCGVLYSSGSIFPGSVFAGQLVVADNAK
jgi:hypothetical protein